MVAQVILGVDTDARGSIALLDTSAWTLDIYPIPNAIRELKSGRKRLHVDFPALGATMHDLTSHATVAWLEEQWSRPGQDIGAMFGFGTTYGSIYSAVAAGFYKNGHSLETVRSLIRLSPGADWKLAIGASSDKAQTRELADRLFPACKYAWVKVKWTSAAEASLLALFGMSRMGIKIPPGTVIQPYKGPPRTHHVESLIL